MIRSLTIAVAALSWVGCASDEVTTKPDMAEYAAIDGALLSKSWPARMANDSARERFEGREGWRAVFQHDLVGALGAFDLKVDPRGVARVHQGLADLYHQAALLAANASIEAYEADAQDSDPHDLAYVIAVSHVIRGDLVKAKASFAEVKRTGPFGTRTQRWLAALGDDERIPSLSQLSSISGDLGEVAPGIEPPLNTTADAELVENTQRAKTIKVMDPTRFLTRSAWHEAAAALAAPQTDAGVLEQIAARYAVGQPTETSYVTLPLDDAWLFASPDLVGADVAFIAEARARGLQSVSAWADKSVLAAALKPAVDADKIVPQEVLDAGFAIQKQLQSMMKDIGGGEMAFHRPFAQRARIAVLMAGMVVADANGQYRDAGILRLNALERMEQVGIEPVFALSVSAWDAGNRNPLRPEELTHQFKSSFPALIATRGPLEALHLRRSRNAGPANPVH